MYLGTHSTAKLAFCAVQQDAQVVALDSEFGANLVLTHLIEEDCSQDSLIAFGQLRKDFPHHSPCFLFNS